MPLHHRYDSGRMLMKPLLRLWGVESCTSFDELIEAAHSMFAEQE